MVPVLGAWAGLSLVVLRPTWVTWPSAGALVGNVIAAAVVVLAGAALLTRA